MTAYYYDGKKLDEIPTQDWEKREPELQDFLLSNYQIIFDEFLEGQDKVIPLGKELRLREGLADFVFLDDVGRLFIVETKLSDNSDRRKIFAQLIDYGQSIYNQFKNKTSVDDFLNICQHSLENAFGKSVNLENTIKSEFGIDNTELEILKKEIQNNIDSNNNIYFIVVMDKIDYSILRTLNYLHSKNIHVYAVEIKKLAIKNSKNLIIPRFYGLESLPPIDERSSSWYGKYTEGWEQFNNLILVNKELDSNIKKSVLKLTAELDKGNDADPYLAHSDKSLSLYFTNANDWNNIVMKIKQDGNIRIFTEAFRVHPELSKKFKSKLFEIEPYVKNKVDEGHRNISVPGNVWFSKVDDYVELFKIVKNSV